MHDDEIYFSIYKKCIVSCNLFVESQSLLQRYISFI